MLLFFQDKDERPHIPNRRRGQKLPAVPEEKDKNSSNGNRRMDNPYDTMEFSTNQGAAAASNVTAASATHTLGASGTYEEIGKVVLDVRSIFCPVSLMLSL